MRYLLLCIVALQGMMPVVAQQDVAMRWETIQTNGKPDARHECCFVEHDGLFYLLGGRGIKPVNIFNPKTNTWTDGAKPPIELHHFQAVTYKDKIYVVGAQTGRYPHEPGIDRFYIYDPLKDEWSLGAEMPKDRQRGASGLVVYKNKFYVLCGITDGHYDGHVAWFDVFDPGTGEWTKLPDAPRARDHFHSVVVKNKLYAIGGRRSSAKTKQVFDLTVPEVDVYNFKTGEWSTLSQPFPIERAGVTATVNRKKIYVVCGESIAHGPAHDELNILDTKTNTWHEGPKLMQGRHGTQVINYKNTLYLAAGCGHRGGKPELDSIEKLVLK